MIDESMNGTEFVLTKKIVSNLIPIEAEAIDPNETHIVFYGVTWLSTWGPWAMGSKCSRIVIDFLKCEIVEINGDGKTIYTQYEFILCPKV